MSSRKGWVLTWISAFVVLFLSAGGTRGEGVRFHLDWVPNGRHLFVYAALSKGFYQEAGLELTVLRGFGAPDSVKKVAAGQAEYGLTDMTSIIVGRVRDLQVRGIAMMYPKGIVDIAFLATSGIKTPKDLSGRTACDSPAGYITIFPAFAALHGITDWKLVNIDPAVKSASLIAGKCDFIVTAATQTAMAQDAAKNVKSPRHAQGKIAQLAKRKAVEE